MHADKFQVSPKVKPWLALSPSKAILGNERNRKVVVEMACFTIAMGVGREVIGRLANGNWIKGIPGS